MFSLFHEYDSSAWDVHYSLLRDGYEFKAIVLEDDGFLPTDVHSIFEAFYGSVYESFLNHKPLHVNNYVLPVEWEFERTDNSYYFKSLRGIEAYVYLHGNPVNRIVERIEWVDSTGFVYKKEYYNQYGQIFKVDNLVKGIGLVDTIRYLDGILYTATFNHQVKSVVVSSSSTTELYFSSFEEFYAFCLDTMWGYQSQSMVFENLGLPLQVLMKRSNDAPNYLVFTESVANGLPDNIKYIKEHPELNTTVILTDKESFDTQDDLKEFKYVGLKVPRESAFGEIHGSNLDAVIATGTDDIHGLDFLLERCPDTTFHIVAPTLMSDKLMSYNSNPKVKLYPAATLEQVKEVFSRCGIFLDIANSGTVFRANRLATEYRLLKMGYWGISSKQYIPSQSMFPSSSDGIANVLNYLREKGFSTLKTLIESQELILGINDSSSFSTVIPKSS